MQSPPSRNASVTPETTSDDYFLFTAATLESTHDDQNHPPEHVDEICLWCDTPSMSCGTANMPHYHNGRVRKLLSPKMPFRPGLFAPSRRSRREDASRPRTLWKGSTFAQDSSPGSVRRRGSRAAIAGRGSTCRQGSATVGRVL